jgi:hypothetical protein
MDDGIVVGRHKDCQADARKNLDCLAMLPAALFEGSPPLAVEQAGRARGASFGRIRQDFRIKR